MADRRNPYDILNQIQKEEKSKKCGKLKIFFGYAAGVGKTYAMLEAAHRAKEQGIDVVIGYVEPHARIETTKLIDGLEKLNTLDIEYKGITLHEFDLDQALIRKPKLILVDELAHTNSDKCRHSKRYKDVEELLNNGIDVYTTINVQHIESLNDIVEAITGVVVKERILDTFFDNASQVELVDIEPKELIKRLKDGKVYKEEQTNKALNNFFTEEKLIALREIALRRSADRINNISQKTKMHSDREYYTDEHILVCLSSSPSNEKLIRNASRMANAFKGKFTALFVETPDFPQITKENKETLRKNVRLAQQLGASIQTVYGENVAYQIAEFSRLSSVSKIIIGRSGVKRKSIFSKPTLSEELTGFAPNLDIYIIPDHSNEKTKRKRKSKKIKVTWIDILKTLFVLTCATVIGFLFDYLGFNETNIITIYILGVLVISVLTPNRIVSLVSSLASVLIFNFFFTVPRFTLSAYSPNYPVTFAVMFISAFFTGSLAIKIKHQAQLNAQNAYRTKVLFETNQLLQQKRIADDIFKVTAQQLNKLLSCDIVYYVAHNDILGDPILFPNYNEKYTTQNEIAVATWVYKNDKHAGVTTDTLSMAKCLYLSVRSTNEVFGVIGLAIENEKFDVQENSLVLSILGECALALEKELSVEREQKALILAKNEQLRANILRTISHDLRTPLTGIMGNADMLINSSSKFSEEKKQELYSDIYDDSIWLINLIENLLSVTRIEDGTLKLNLQGELIDDIINEAIRHTNKNSKDHQIKVVQNDEFLMAKMDSRLILQVIINIVNNALKYTPRGATITLSSYSRKEFVVVEIADDGDGISDDDKRRIFDMFYTVDGKIADGRRGLGLGLALCKSIVAAHGSSLTVRDNVPRGLVFSFALPKEEVNLNV